MEKVKSESRALTTSSFEQSRTTELHMNHSGIYYAHRIARDQTRLLILQPAEDLRQSISCELVVASPTAIRYEALSYVWGNPSLTCSITVDGYPFKVTQNLHDALLRLRRRLEPRTLWIDAICINQRDVAERGHQVGIMSGIYSKAQGVLVWLGEFGGCDGLEYQDRALESGDDYDDCTRHGWLSPIPEGVRCVGSDLLLGQTITSAPHGSCYCTSTSTHYSSTFVACHYLNGVAEGLKITGAGPSIWSPDTGFSSSTGAVNYIVSRIYTASWWSRVWVLQEALRSTSTPLAMFGNNTISLSVLVRAADNYHQARANLASSIHGPLYYVHDSQRRSFAAMALFRRGLTAGTELSIDLALQLTATRQTSEPRDRLYSILGLLNEETRSLIIPDYHASMADICVLAMRVLLRTGEKNQYLQYASWNDTAELSLGHLPAQAITGPPQLPSWVVNFGQPDWNVLPESFIPQMRHHIMRDGARTWHKLSAPVIHVEAQYLGKICERDSHIRTDGDRIFNPTEGFVEYLSSPINTRESSNFLLPQLRDISNYSRSMVNLRFDGVTAVYEWDTRRIRVMSFDRNKSFAQERADRSPASDSYEDLTTPEETQWLPIILRQPLLIRTDKGVAAFTWSRCRLGDEVWRVDGCEFCLIVAEADRENDRFGATKCREIVGKCELPSRLSAPYTDAFEMVTLKLV